MILTSGDTIQLDDLPDDLNLTDRAEPVVPENGQDIDIDVFIPNGVELTPALEAVERGLIHRAMTEAQGVQAHAADMLNIKKNVMKYKLDKYPLRNLDVVDLEQETGLDFRVTQYIPKSMGLNEALEIIEKKMIQRALAETKGVQAHAAELLGIKKNVMQYKMKKYNLQ